MMTLLNFETSLSDSVFFSARNSPISLSISMRAIACICSSLLVQGVFSQVNTGSDIGFSAIGKVTSATQRDTKDPLSGGTVGINGRTIIIPDNTVCTLPANTGACSFLFAFNCLAAAEFLFLTH
jgi:hypothetical protein